MPGGPLQKEIAADHGIHPAIISKWVKKYGINQDMKNKNNKSPHKWSPEEKLLAIKETDPLSEEELGAYLRSHGLHSHHLEDWNKEILMALKSKFYPNKKDPKVLSLENECKSLQKQLQRKEKALAEAAALLLLKKKADAYFSDEE